MATVFGGILVVAAGFVLAAYRFSTRQAGHVTVATGFFWIFGAALLWVNEHTFPNDETRREIGEWVAMVPVLIALPLSLISVTLILAGLNRKKEA